MAAPIHARRVLLVDDFAPVRVAIRSFLEQHRIAVVEASTCAEAVRLLETEQLDAMVVDYLLPDGTAFDVLPAHKNKAAIVLTAHPTIDLTVRAIEGGADELMSKPVQLRELRSALERAMDWAERQSGEES